MEIPLTGPAYKHPYIDSNYQRCVNMYPMLPGPNGRGQSTLVPTSGLYAFHNFELNSCRGLAYYNNCLYTVIDNKLYKAIVNVGTLVIDELRELGELQTSSSTVYFASNPNQLFITDGSASGYCINYINSGSAVYGNISTGAGNTYSLSINSVVIYDERDMSTSLTAAALTIAINLQTPYTGITASNASGTITLTAIDDRDIALTESGTGFNSGTEGLTVTGGDFTTTKTVFNTVDSTDNYPGGVMVKFLDGYFVVNEPNSGRFYTSALNNGLSWDALDVATAESSPDDIVGFGVSRGELWIFGKRTTEIWYNAGNASGMPLSPREGAEITVGCASASSITEIDDIIMWLDNRGYIVRSDISPYMRNNNTGGAAKIVSDDAISSEILTYDTYEDAIAMTYLDRGHIMYQITFISAKKTWVYDTTTGAWHERVYTEPDHSKPIAHLAKYCVKYDSKYIVANTTDSKLYFMSHDFKDDNGVLIRRIRTSPPMNDEFKLVGIDCLELRMSTGEALASGNGSDPQISLRYSTNGGHTWSDYMMRSAGKVGEYNKRIQWYRLGVASEWVFEVSFSDPIDFSIIGASASVSETEI